MWIWTRIRNIGGNPDEEADVREEFGGEDPGEADEKYIKDSGDTSVRPKQACQSASKFDPRSASKGDPLVGE